ncbi:MAG: carboxypeptidase-like regulatory domain-containing protein, partial [Cyclobacteriaceae bacterium]
MGRRGKKELKSGVLILLISLVSLLTYGQSEVTITGKVTDDTGSALPGVTIIIENTSSGTVSNADGSFTLQAASNQVLVFQMIGMQTQRQPINGQTTFNIRLSEEASILDEVIVTGFQEVDRKLFTGASENVKMSDIKIDGMADAGRALEGRVAGVSVDNVSGTFGTSPKIRIRGNASINGNNQPLFVVDGVILEDLSNVNAEDF